MNTFFKIISLTFLVSGFILVPSHAEIQSRYDVLTHTESIYTKTKVKVEANEVSCEPEGAFAVTGYRIKVNAKDLSETLAVKSINFGSGISYATLEKCKAAANSLVELSAEERLTLQVTEKAQIKGLNQTKQEKLKCQIAGNVEVRAQVKDDDIFDDVELPKVLENLVFLAGSGNVDELNPSGRIGVGNLGTACLSSETLDRAQSLHPQLLKK